MAYRLLITAPTFDELKDKIREAAQGVGGITVVDQNAEAVEEMYHSTSEEITEEVKETPAPKVETPQPPAPTNPLAVPAEDKGDDTHDSEGMPWDERIHNSRKTKNQDGTWRKKRGVDQSLVDEVEAELKGQPKAAPAPAVPEAPTTTVQVEMPTTPVVEAPAPVAAPAPPTPQPASHNGHTFDTFKANIATIFVDLTNQGKINQEYVQQLCQHFGINMIFEAFQDEAKVREIYDSFSDYGFIQRMD